MHLDVGQKPAHVTASATGAVCLAAFGVAQVQEGYKKFLHYRVKSASPSNSFKFAKLLSQQLRPTHLQRILGDIFLQGSYLHAVAVLGAVVGNAIFQKNRDLPESERSSRPADFKDLGLVGLGLLGFHVAIKNRVSTLPRYILMLPMMISFYRWAEGGVLDVCDALRGSSRD